MRDQVLAQEKKEKGNRFVKEKKYEKALPCYEEAIRYDPQFKEAWFNKGLAHQNLNQLPEALSAFSEAVRIDPAYQKAIDNCRSVQAQLWIAEGHHYQEAYKLLKQCPRTARVEQAMIQAANHFKAGIFFGRVDLKLTDQNQIKILALGHGMRSRSHETTIDELNHALSSLKLPFFVVDRPGVVLVNKFNEEKEFINKHHIQNRSDIDFSEIKNYSGIYCSQEYGFHLYDNILTFNENLPALLIPEDKIVTHQFFETVSEYRPHAKILPRQYSANLARTIQQEMKSEFYVLKIAESKRSDGVWLAHKTELNEVLAFLLEQDPKKSALLFFAYLKRKEIPQENAFFNLSLLTNWHSSLDPQCLIEAYVPSKKIIHKQKYFDPTLRVSFLIIRDNNRLTFKPVGAYWQLPKEALGHPDFRLSRITALNLSQEDCLPVDESDLTTVYQQLSACLPQVFQDLFTFDVEAHRQKLVKSRSSTEKRSGYSLTMRVANALGQKGYVAAALDILASIENEYSNAHKICHERGLIYHRNGFYQKALEQYSLALAHESVFSTYYRRGLTYYALGQLDLAASDLRESCQEPNPLYRSAYEQVEAERKQMEAHPKSPSPSDQSQTIDLHGLSVKEAKEVLGSTFSKAREAKFRNLTVITGIGRHVNSNGTRGVLFNTVPRWLKQPAFSRAVREVTQDQGAYEIEFNFAEGEEARIKEYADKINALLGTVKLEQLILTHEEKAQEGDSASQLFLGMAYTYGIGLKSDFEKGIAWLEKAAVTCVEAQTLLGIIFYRRKEYKQALQWFSYAEKKGDPVALFYLGTLYWLGRGLIKNDAKAINYLTQASRANHVIAGDASCNLGNIHFEGQGSIAKNPALAAEFYLLAAKSGNVFAQVKLAKQYFFGWGIDQEEAKAFYWFKEAALAGELIAEYYLGYCYETGRGVTLNLAEAKRWYEKSAEQGDLDAQLKLAYAQIEGFFGEKNLEQGLNKLEQLAAKNHPPSLFFLGEFLLEEGSRQDVPRGLDAIVKAAQFGEILAQKALGRLYWTDQYTQSDKAKALYWLREAAKQKDPEALYDLAVLLEEQTEYSSVQESLTCLMESAQLGFASAQYLLASIYLEGDATLPQNIDKAVELLEPLANQGHPEAQFSLAILYSKGEHPRVAENKNKAFYYFQQAAVDESNKDAQTGLAFCYLNGSGTAVDHEKAKEYFAKAAKLGDPVAQEHLAALLQQEIETQSCAIQATRRFSSDLFSRRSERHQPETENLKSDSRSFSI